MLELDWWPPSRQSSYHYSLVDEEKENSPDESALSFHGRRRPHTFYSALVKIVACTVLLIAALSISFNAGKFYERQQPANNSFNVAPSLKPLPIQLEYNSSFGDAPNLITEAAWDNLLPVQGGFFQHPTVAPVRSDFAVFHQLHCLVSQDQHRTLRYNKPARLGSLLKKGPKQNGIRQAFWFTHEAAIQGRRLTETDYPEMIAPRHMSHCIDLLRQVLMCQPDLTVELKDERGGVTGFGTVHQCKDWRQLMEWMGEWETFGQAEPYVPEEHHHHGHSLVGGMGT